jgi:predicted Zn-dependent peptidase
MRLAFFIAALAAMLGGAAAPAAQVSSGQNSTETALRLDTQYFTLPNGLKVVLSREPSAPTATIAVYYGIGFRIEPKNRTGFAHLFEHLMYQGSRNAPKGTFIGAVTNAGGRLNGSTRYDYTSYYQVVPAKAIDLVLWLEADRMARPAFTQAVLENQQAVVANEVKVVALNQPYGGWPQLDMPSIAYSNWYNAHDFYRKLDDLSAATLEDANTFFDSFYRPNNAVLVIAGDIDYAATRRLVSRYFGPIPKGAPVELPDISEPRQTEEKIQTKVDKLAPKPAFAAAWHVPPRGTPEWYAMGLLDQILVQGQDSRLFKKLVRERGITNSIRAGINILFGNMFNYKGPMLWTVAFVHDSDRSREEVTGALNEVIEEIRTNGVSQEELDRSRTKLRANLYSTIATGTRFGLAELLAVGALWEDDPLWFTKVERGFDQVTPELLRKTAQEYLRPTNRSILFTEAGASAAGASK